MAECVHLMAWLNWSILFFSVPSFYYYSRLWARLGIHQDQEDLAFECHKELEMNSME